MTSVDSSGDGGTLGEETDPAPAGRERSRWVDWGARLAAGLVLIVGTAVVIVPAVDLRPLRATPFESQTVVETGVTTGREGKVARKTTTREVERSFAERGLAVGGLLLLRLGIVVLAAFLAGAVVQRTLLGEFAVKLGPIEIPEAKRTAALSERALDKVKEELARQARATAYVMSVAAETAERLEELRDGLGAFVGALDAESLGEAMEGVAEEPPVDVQFEEEPDTAGDEDGGTDE